MVNTNIICFFCLSLITLVSSCRKSPEYPTTPVIKFNTIERNLIYDNFGQVYIDSLTFHIDFTDGDGDLGVEEDDSPSSHTYVYDSLGNKIHYDPSDASLPPFSCSDYVVLNSSGGQDTFLIKENPDYYNFYVRIFEKKTSGVYEEVDLSNVCPNFNGRFGQLYPDGYEGDLEGTLRYGIKDDFFNLNFENKTLKFRIRIRDNAGNRSNEVETSPINFTY